MLHTIHFFLITIILVIVAIFDSKFKIIPNRYVIMIAALSVVYVIPQVLFFGKSPLSIMAGVAVGACVLLPAYFVTGKSFGAGDVKIFMALGISLGAMNLLLCVLGTMMGALVYAVYKRMGCVSTPRGQFSVSLKGDRKPSPWSEAPKGSSPWLNCKKSAGGGIAMAPFILFAYILVNALFL